MTDNDQRTARPTVLITRPEVQGRRFGAELAYRLGQDWPIVAAPLLKIRFLHLTAEPSGFSALIFTSENGVAAFVAQSTVRIAAWCVGERTAEVAQDAGFNVFTGGGTAEALVAAILTSSQIGPMLHLHGEHAVADIAKALTLAGTETVEAEIYAQDSLSLGPVVLDLLRGAGPVVVPLFSPRTARIFQAECPVNGAPLLIAALSPAVAKCLTLPVRVLITCIRPDGTAMLNAVTQLIADRTA